MSQINSITNSLQKQYDKLCIHEPELKSLLTEIKLEHGYLRKSKQCSLTIFFRHGYIDRLNRLVGKQRMGKPGILQTEQAYNVAYNFLFSSLNVCEKTCLDCNKLREINRPMEDEFEDIFESE